jgi:hypothetical protein
MDETLALITILGSLLVVGLAFVLWITAPFSWQVGSELKKGD